MRLSQIVLAVFVMSLVAALAHAQTPPCGKAVVAVGGEKKIEGQFVPAPPELVRVAAIQAVPAMADKVQKVEGFEIEATADMDLYGTVRTMNKDQGSKGLSHGMGAPGAFHISISPASKDGKAGSSVSVEFHKTGLAGRAGSAAQARPLMDEIACLADTFAVVDPASEPSGPGAKPSADAIAAVIVPEGTLIKLTLREFLYSKTIKKNTERAIPFEVAEDVKVGGATVIRRGAYAVGRFVDAKAARGYQRSALLQFVIEEVTAVDGQKLQLTSGKLKQQAKDESTVTKAMTTMPVLGWLDKGHETLIRAGTGYVVEVKADSKVMAAR